MNIQMGSGRNAASWAGTMIVCLLLAACGGGGGGGEDIPDDGGGGSGESAYSFTLDEENAVDVLSMALILGELVKGLGSDESVFWWVYSALPGLTPGQAYQVPIDDVPCESAGMTIKLNDNDGDEEASSGDTVDVYNISDCYDSSFRWYLTSTDSAENPGVVITVNSMTGRMDDDYALDLFIEFRNLQIEMIAGPNFTVNGMQRADIEFSFSLETDQGSYETRFSGAALSIEGSAPLRDFSGDMDFALTLRDYSHVFSTGYDGTYLPYSWRFDGLVDISDVSDGTDRYAGTLNLETLQAFSGEQLSNPSSGRLKLTGQNSSVSLIAIGDEQVRLELDLGDDGSVDAAETVFWSDVINL